MVPRETWPTLAGLQPNPARILTLEPERSASEGKKRAVKRGFWAWILRAQAACGFR